ncbi:MAG: LOG family protein [Nanoarchaeota archaeon]
MSSRKCVRKLYEDGVGTKEDDHHIIGGSRPDADVEALAYEIGRRVALKGHTLKNGGNAGVMAASSRGCVEHGGTAIGCVVEGSDTPGLNQRNGYSTETKVFTKYHDRVAELMDTDRIVVLPGQVGTLGELFHAWVEAIVYSAVPILLIGKRNKQLLDFLVENGFVDQAEHLPYVQYVESIDEIEFLKQ